MMYPITSSYSTMVLAYVEPILRERLSDSSPFNQPIQILKQLHQYLSYYELEPG